MKSLYNEPNYKERAKLYEWFKDQPCNDFTRHKGAVWFDRVGDYLVVAVHSPLYMGGLFTVIGFVQCGPRVVQFMIDGAEYTFDHAIETILAADGRGADFAKTMLTASRAGIKGPARQGERAKKRIGGPHDTWYSHYRGNVWISDQNVLQMCGTGKVVAYTEWLNVGMPTCIGFVARDGEDFRASQASPISKPVPLDDLVEVFLFDMAGTVGRRNRIAGYRKNK